MPNPIPPASREAVEKRDGRECVRCSIPTIMGHWHHRRSRSVRDDHQHCPCNGIYLCPTCHEWAHKNPFEARRYGWIVSRNVAEPFREAAYTPGTGWRFPLCNGEWFTRTEREQMDEHEYEIIEAPIPGSPRKGFYIVDHDDEDFEDGPHGTYAAAEEALGEIAARRQQGED